MFSWQIKKVTDLSSGQEPLEMAEVPVPGIGAGEILVKVHACGVCHTELDEIEGRAVPAFYPVIPGHQVVGTVAAKERDLDILNTGDRVGIGWFYSSCGKCAYCLSGNDNLCQEFKATGKDADGGYAEFIKVPATSAFLIPPGISDTEAAPLLCAGAIGYRSLRLAGIDDGQVLGLTGFGASAHLVLKMARYLYPSAKIFVFARSENERNFAMELGADWAGDTHEKAPGKMHAIIDTTPVWKPVVDGLLQLLPGGRMVINAIRKEKTDLDYLLNISYPEHLWMEKEIKTVANVASGDIRDFLELAGKIEISPEVEIFPFKDANKALLELKNRKIRGAKVLVF